MNTQSTYMHFAKTRARVKYDLALSGILNLPWAELGATIDDLDINGDNSYGYGPLVDALAAHANVSPESVVTISGGTSMANHLAMAAAIDHGDEVLIEQPTYEPLLALAEYFGANIRRFPRRAENNYRIDLDALTSQVTPRTRLIVLTNMHNPSSALTDQETLRAVGDIAAKVGARVLVDEVYLEALFGNVPPSCVHLGSQFIATSSLTKGYGLSGLRCGWILAEPELAQRMRMLHDIFGALAPHPAERLSVLAMTRLPKFIERARHILETNRAVLNDFYDSREELQVEQSRIGTTSFPRLMRGHVDELYDVLTRDYDAAVVPGKYFESPQHFRIGLCADPAAFAGGVERLGQALDRLSA
jgi:aspartate/methionine/tyrosine aminotransferase